MCHIFFAGYDLVGIDFLEYAEDGPLPRVVVDELRSEISPYFVLLTVLTAGTVEVLFDMGGLS